MAISAYRKAGWAFMSADIVLLAFTLFSCSSACSNMSYVGRHMQPTIAVGPARADPVDNITNGALELAMRDQILSRLKDPDSAKFTNVTFHHKPGSANSVCGNVNSKNGFGGYNGPQSFISGGTPETTVLVSDMKRREFRKVWKMLCVDAPIR